MNKAFCRMHWRPSTRRAKTEVSSKQCGRIMVKAFCRMHYRALARRASAGVCSLMARLVWLPWRLTITIRLQVVEKNPTLPLSGAEDTPKGVCVCAPRAPFPGAEAARAQDGPGGHAQRRLGVLPRRVRGPAQRRAHALLGGGARPAHSHAPSRRKHQSLIGSLTLRYQCNSFVATST